MIKHLLINGLKDLKYFHDDARLSGQVPLMKYGN